MLDAARQLGFLGPGPLDVHIQHSLAFATMVEPPNTALDLGSGGGIPGFVLAHRWPESTWTFLDGNTRRTDFLREAVAASSIAGRAVVVTTRAEEAARTELRATMDLVVARGFGPAAVTAECGAPFLSVRGSLLVSEPPGGLEGRWRGDWLRELGLTPSSAVTAPVALQLLTQERPCPQRYPRRTGIPAKRPLSG